MLREGAAPLSNLLNGESSVLEAGSGVAGQGGKSRNQCPVLKLDGIRQWRLKPKSPDANG